jgi:hypothetical protein
VIFISYARPDAGVAHEFARRLSGYSCDYWIDTEALNLHAPVEPQIWTAVESARAVVLFDSPHSRTSPWVSYELHTATTLGRPICSLAVMKAGGPHTAPTRPPGLLGE